MSLHLVQLKVMAVGTVGCGVVNLCGSNTFPVLGSTILIAFAFLVLVACIVKQPLPVLELWYCVSKAVLLMHF